MLERLCECPLDDQELLEPLLEQLKSELAAHVLALDATLLHTLDEIPGTQQLSQELRDESHAIVGLTARLENPRDISKLFALRETLEHFSFRIDLEAAEKARLSLDPQEREELGSRLLFMRNVEPFTHPPAARNGAFG